MTAKTAIVSGANSRYYNLLCELIASVKPFNLPVCVFDVGLEPGQAAELKAEGITVVAPDWPCAIPASRIRGRDYLKACVARPFIPYYFPGFDTYIWLDADAWVQTREALDLLQQGAARGRLAVVPQIDRAWGKTMRLGWLGPLPWKPRSFYYNNARKAFGGAMARALFPFVTVNAGVFALRADAPHWKHWQELIVQTLKKGRVFTAEQLSMGIMIHLKKCSVEFLPAWCNWLIGTKPLWDEDRKIFVEPFLPHHPISIIHMSGVNEMRADRTVTTDYETLQGKTLRMNCRYPL